MFCNILANIEEHYVGHEWQYLNLLYADDTFLFSGFSVFTTTEVKVLFLWLPLLPKVDLQAKQIFFCFFFFSSSSFSVGSTTLCFLTLCRTKSSLTKTCTDLYYWERREKGSFTWTSGYSNTNCTCRLFSVIFYDATWFKLNPKQFFFSVFVFVFFPQTESWKAQ